MFKFEDLKHIKTATKEASAYIEGRMNGEIRSLKTSWNKYNEAHIDGVEMKRVNTLAGMSGSGKTAISAQLERDLFPLNPHEDFAVLSFNFEMPSMDIVMRSVMSKHDVTYRELLSANGLVLDKHKFENIKLFLENDVAKLEIYYVEYPKTVTEYIYIMKMFADRIKKKFISVSDHSILFKRGATEKTVQETLYNLADASIALKKELPCTQFHLTQMNREIEKVERRVPKSHMNYPTKDCIFGGDALYFASDTILVNHRPYLLDFPANTYGINKLPTGPNDVYWHFIKLRHSIPHVARMRGDFANMVILDT